VPDPDYSDDTIPANRTFLLDMIADIGTNRFEYVYDLGDHWSHTIKIVKPMPAVPGIDYPLLIDAVGRCPLEDSGSPPGYLRQRLRRRATSAHAVSYPATAQIPLKFDGIAAPPKTSGSCQFRTLVQTCDWPFPMPQ
jgi:hypothetical protein